MKFHIGIFVQRVTQQKSLSYTPIQKGQILDVSISKKSGKPIIKLVENGKKWFPLSKFKPLSMPRIDITKCNNNELKMAVENSQCLNSIRHHTNIQEVLYHRFEYTAGQLKAFNNAMAEEFVQHILDDHTGD